MLDWGIVWFLEYEIYRFMDTKIQLKEAASLVIFLTFGLHLPFCLTRPVNFGFQ